jgi:glycerol-1-phosphate dehydrogenase [NAD(P)+]
MPLAEINEARPVTLLTSGPAWRAVQTKLKLNIVRQVEVTEATIQAWDNQLAEPHGDVVYAIGGGLPADAAKYLAYKKSLELVCIPTVLSVDAFLTWASGIRSQGCVRYIATKPPDHLVIDLDVIAEAPPDIRAAGICDVLSIATGLWDWKYAEERRKNPPGMEWIPYIDQAANAILQGTLDCAEAAGRGDWQGLKQLLDCLALEVQLTNQIGHSRPEEGSEHYFAYAVENKVGSGKPHANLVCPGILLIARAQGQDVHVLRRAMEECSIKFDSIPEEVIEKTLVELPGYCQEHDLPFGIAHVLRKEQVKELMMS